MYGMHFFAFSQQTNVDSQLTSTVSAHSFIVFLMNSTFIFPVMFRNVFIGLYIIIAILYSRFNFAFLDCIRFTDMYI